MHAKVAGTTLSLIHRVVVIFSAVFFSLLGLFWMIGGAISLLALQEGAWSIFGGVGTLTFGIFSISAAVATIRKRRWGRLALIVVSAANALWWTIVGLAPYMLSLLKLRPTLPEEAETPTGPFSVLAVLSIFFLIFLLLPERGGRS